MTGGPSDAFSFHNRGHFGTILLLGSILSAGISIFCFAGRAATAKALLAKLESKIKKNKRGGRRNEEKSDDSA